MFQFFSYHLGIATMPRCTQPARHLPATKQTREVQGERNVFAVLGKAAPLGFERCPGSLIISCTTWTAQTRHSNNLK